MALMFAICRPQPNWMPRNPKLMFQICQKPSLGFSIGGPPCAGILPHGLSEGSRDLRRLAEPESEDPCERPVGGAAADEEAARGIEAMPLHEHHAEAGQGLAAPADGRAVAVRAPRVLDAAPEELVRARE